MHDTSSTAGEAASVRFAVDRETANAHGPRGDHAVTCGWTAENDVNTVFQFKKMELFPDLGIFVRGSHRNWSK